MNVCIRMPDGSLYALTAHDAEVMDGFLADRECHGPEVDHLAIRRLRSQLKFALAKETHFDMDRYTPPGYVPGWAQEQ